MVCPDGLVNIDYIVDAGNCVNVASVVYGVNIVEIMDVVNVVDVAFC